MNPDKEPNAQLNTSGDDRDAFDAQSRMEVAAQGADEHLQAQTVAWYNSAARHKYSYHFKWLGVPIIQHPSDIVVMQELIHEVKPDLIIECGVARGGSLIFNASMLDMVWRHAGDSSKGHVIGIDIDIRPHNRDSIERHALADRITLVQGSSIDADVVRQVRDLARPYSRVMVLLDSNHTHDHVLAELLAYSGLVTKGSYCVVFDTVIEDLDDDLVADRPWGKGNSPLSALEAFLKQTDAFEIDPHPHNKALITVAKSGFLKRVK